MKLKKRFKYKLIIFVIMFLIWPTNHVMAEPEETLDGYGIFCQYGNYYYLIEADFAEDIYEIDTNFNELNIDIPTNRDWWRANGIIITSGENEVFNCPSNPFGTTLGNATNKTLGQNNGILGKIPSVTENNYSCTYKGQNSGNTLTIQYLGNLWNITFPDGQVLNATRSDFNSKFGINLIYDEDCSLDLYYLPNEKLIQFSSVDNLNPDSNYNDVLLSLCQKYPNSTIEHYCSGNCQYKELSCPTTNIDWGDAVDDNCEGIIGQDLLDFINDIFRWIQILAPIFVIIMGGIDFAGAILQDDKDALKKASNKFVKRLIIAVALFFIPLILSFILNIFNDITGAGSSTCGIGG